MNNNDPQLCICPFNPSYILTPVQLDINRCVGRAEKERTQEQRNNGAPVPLRAQMFNYSRKQQMALSSFNFCACDWDEIPPKPKEMQDQMFRFVCFYVVERSRPIIQHLNRGVSGALSWSQGVHMSYPSVSGGRSSKGCGRKRFPPSLCGAVRGAETTQQTERAAWSPIKTKLMRFFHMCTIRSILNLLWSTLF